MNELGLFQSPVYLAPLVLTTAAAYSSATEGDFELRGLPLALVLLVAPLCLSDASVDAVIETPILAQLLPRVVALADVPERYRRLTPVSLRATSVLLGSALVVRVREMDGSLAFRPREDIRSHLDALASPDLPARKAAEKLGGWWRRASTAEVLRACGVFS